MFSFSEIKILIASRQYWLFIVVPVGVFNVLLEYVELCDIAFFDESITIQSEFRIVSLTCFPIERARTAFKCFVCCREYVNTENIFISSHYIPKMLWIHKKVRFAQ